jgi:hypothetical protein
LFLLHSATKNGFPPEEQVLRITTGVAKSYETIEAAAGEREKQLLRDQMMKENASFSKIC